MTHNLLDIEHLRVDLPVAGRLRRVIHDVSLSLRPGEALGLVGESGSGKSMTARAIMRLLVEGAEVSGRLDVDGQAVGALRGLSLRRYRQRQVGMIYQDPRAHMNPIRTVGDFLLEGLLEDGRVRRAEALDRVITTLQDVGVPDAARRLSQYPHQLSGGLLQRVMIASVLVAEPQLILADEPTTALDVTTQQEVMAILEEQRRERGLAMLFITHDLDLAIAATSRIAVMYAGVIVESAPSEEVHDHAFHPYTAALLASRPSLDRTERLSVIAGRSVSAFETGDGCVFVSRCPHALSDVCSVRPEIRPLDGHLVACHRASELRSVLHKEEPVRT